MWKLIATGVVGVIFTFFGVALYITAGLYDGLNLVDGWLITFSIWVFCTMLSGIFVAITVMVLGDEPKND